MLYSHLFVHITPSHKLYSHVLLHITPPHQLYSHLFVQNTFAPKLYSHLFAHIFLLINFTHICVYITSPHRLKLDPIVQTNSHELYSHLFAHITSPDMLYSHIFVHIFSSHKPNSHLFVHITSFHKLQSRCLKKLLWSHQTSWQRFRFGCQELCVTRSLSPEQFIVHSKIMIEISFEKIRITDILPIRFYLHPWNVSSDYYFYQNMKLLNILKKLHKKPFSYSKDT